MKSVDQTLTGRLGRPVSDGLSAEIAAAITSERGSRCGVAAALDRPIETRERVEDVNGDRDEQSGSPSFHGNGAR